MALEPGARFGPYEIVSPAGAGGMGEVYRARDTRLDRTVAIKVLPPDLTSDPTARQRFEREARAVAALSHPHICTLHDIGHQDGTDYLVMEYLDGETLAARLTRGKLPVDQALQYGIQIADALAAAHKAGIVHRDLKPGNVMLTKSGAKLLDFGLAKPGVQLAGLGTTQLATQGPLTGAGTLLGTLHYMAPEQLQGATADARADVFAFGCVLYEMVTGRQAFAGDTPASVIAAVLDREPASVGAGSEQMAHPALDGVIRTCLAKNPEDRWSSGHDLWLTLRRFAQAADAPVVVAPSKSRSRRAVIPWVIAALFFATTIAAVYRLSSRPPAVSAAPAMQASIDFPNAWLVMPLLSPNGHYMSLYSFSGVGQEGRVVLIRQMASGEATWLAGTEHALPLTWSPDSRSLAVFVNGDIKAVDIATGGVRTIGRAPDDVVPFGCAWSGEYILLGGSRLRRMSITDGHVTDVYRVDAEVSRQRFPSFLPDGRTFLYSQESSNQARRGLFVSSIDSPEVSRLLPEPEVAMISPRGYLLFGRQGTLFAQQFDLDRHRLIGDPVAVGSGIDSFGPFAGFAVNGDIVVWSSGTVLPPGRLTWMDRNGRKLDEIGQLQPYRQVVLAPDGQRAVTEEVDPRTGSSLFLIELARPMHARLTTGDQRESDPVWSPDSREVAFNSGGAVFTRRIDQTGRTPLFARPVTAVEDWTHDGRFVILGLSMQNISALPLAGDRQPMPLIESSSSVDEPHVSRDGRWLAYSSDDTAQWEVYVQSFKSPGGRIRVSTNGASQPRWRADGRELFYRALDGAMMSVDMADPAKPGAPRKLFDLRFWVNPVEDQYDVTADGQRFIVIIPEGQQATRLTLLTNWPSVVAGR